MLQGRGEEGRNSRPRRRADCQADCPNHCALCASLTHTISQEETHNSIPSHWSERWLIRRVKCYQEKSSERFLKLIWLVTLFTHSTGCENTSTTHERPATQYTHLKVTFGQLDNQSRSVSIFRILNLLWFINYLTNSLCFLTLSPLYSRSLRRDVSIVAHYRWSN